MTARYRVSMTVVEGLVEASTMPVISAVVAAISRRYYRLTDHGANVLSVQAGRSRDSAALGTGRSRRRAVARPALGG